MNARIPRLVEYAPGELICRQGARADRAFVLRKGAVRSTVLPERDLAAADDGLLSQAHGTALHTLPGTFLACESVLSGLYLESLVAADQVHLAELPLDAPGVMNSITEDISFGLALARHLARRLLASSRGVGAAARNAARFARDLQGMCADFYNQVQELGETIGDDDAVLQALSAAKRAEVYALGEAGGAEVCRQTMRLLARHVDTPALGGTWVHAKAGDVLCRKGDPGDTIYLLASGRLAIRIGKEQFGVIRPGETVGEIGALLSDEEPKRAADVVAEADSVVAIVPRDQFPELARRQPKLLVNLCKLLTLRARNFDQLAVDGTGAMQGVAQKFLGTRASFSADLKALKRSLEALIADNGLPLESTVAALTRLDDRWVARADELRAQLPSQQPVT